MRSNNPILSFIFPYGKVQNQRKLTKTKKGKGKSFLLNVHFPFLVAPLDMQGSEVELGAGSVADAFFFLLFLPGVHPLHLFNGQCRPVRAPAGRAEDVHEFMAPIAGTLHVIPDILIFVQKDDHRVVGVGRMNDPVFDLDLFVVVGPGPKQLVKEVEVTAVVLIQVFQVLGMVDLVLGMRVQEFFQKAQLGNILRMNLQDCFQN